MYSSASDLSALGRAILKYRLIDGPLTRRWLKPYFMTSDIVAGIGAPWGTRRIRVGTGTNSNRIVDALGKAGSINYYQALLIVVPDYDIGITALLAGGWPGNANWEIADRISEVLFPALEEAARTQAQAEFGGTYSSSDANLNSTITFSTAPDRPGLGVDRWISNGTDMIPITWRLTLPGVDVTAPFIRLFPTGLETTNADGSKKMAFKAAVENLNDPSHEGDMFSTQCGKWVSQTAVVYADRPLDQFVFHTDTSGKVISVENLALRATLTRQTQV
jgi:hypothetical protein